MRFPSKAFWVTRWRILLATAWRRDATITSSAIRRWKPKPTHWRRERSERDRSRRSCSGRWYSHKARTGMPDGDSKRCNDFNKPKEQGHHSAVTVQPPRGIDPVVLGRT